MARSAFGFVLFFILATGDGASSFGYVPLAYLNSSAGTDEVDVLYWQEIQGGLPIPFSIANQGTPDIELSSDDPALDEYEAIELAFRTWEQVRGVPVRFSLQRTDTNQFGYDGENVIFFADLGDVDYGGVTLITFDNETGQILDVDIHMNDSGISWFTSPNDADGEPLPCPCAGTAQADEARNDIQGLATHEIGHALGLDHSAIGYREFAKTPTMFPRGIWNVPGDGSRPANSRYRTLELDDRIGLQYLYPPADWETQVGEITGVVHDGEDRPLFGAHVVARDLETGTEVGTMSGVVAGPYRAQTYQLRGLPPGQYEVRVEPLVGAPPGYVSRFNFGGINQALIPAKFPSVVDLTTTFHRFVFDPTLATPVTVTAGNTETIPFRPIASLKRLPRFFRVPQPFDIQGTLNADVTGSVQQASVVYTVDGVDPIAVDLPLSGSFSVPMAKLRAGSVLEYRVEVRTTQGDTFHTLPVKLQVGLSAEPLVLVSKHGSWKLSVVDTKTLFEVDEIGGNFSFPLGLALHKERHGVYVTNFGTDSVSFIPLSKGDPRPTNPRSFDSDGDGLLDELEPLFGTDPANSDTDGDLALDGDEVSQWENTGNLADEQVFYVLGGTVASDGQTPLGDPFVSHAVFNVTQGDWATASMAGVTSGRFKLQLPAGSTYEVSFFNNSTGSWIADSQSFTGSAGEVVSIGVTRLQFPPPDPKPDDTGTDPLDPLSGAIGVLLPAVREIALDGGADPQGIALSPGKQRYAYVTGTGTDKVYMIDTQEDALVTQAPVGAFPKGIAVAHDGTKVYVANVNSSTLSVLNATSLETVKTISLSGKPEYVKITPDGSTAVVTMSGSEDVAFIDTSTDQVRQVLSTGIGGLVFLAAHPTGADLLLAGNFTVGNTKLALIDVSAKTVRSITLDPAVETTSGLALHPDAGRGYVVHYSNPELIEFDVQTGAVLRRLAFDFVDTRDLLLVDQLTLSASSFAQFGNGANFVSSIVLTNPSQSQWASGFVSLFDDQGEPLFVSLNGKKPASWVSFSIERLGRATFETDGAGSVVTGSVRVTSDSPVGGVVKFAFPDLGMAGVGESAPLASFMTPAVRQESLGLNTGIAITNLEDAQAQLTLSLRGLDGSEVAAGSVPLTLPGRGHLARFINELFPNAETANFQGTLNAAVTTGGGRVSATAIQLGASAGQFTTLPVIPVDPASTEKQLFFAQFGKGSGFSSLFFLINPLNTTASGELSFLDDEGNPLAISLGGQPVSERVSFNIQPYGSAVFETDGLGEVIAGSARATAGSVIGGVLKFALPSLGIAGVGASVPTSGFVTPVTRSLERSVSTGVAITSAGSPATLTLILRNQRGKPLPGGQNTIQLEANGHLARFIQELFPAADTREFEGTLTVTSGEALVAATAILLGTKPGEFTTLPVTSLR